MQGFSGGKFCRVTNRVSVGRQESAPGARAPQPVVAGNQAAGGWVHAGGADSALGPARQGRGAGGPSGSQTRHAWEIYTQGRKKVSSQLALVFYINHKCIGRHRNASESLGCFFAGPCNFPNLGILAAQNERFSNCSVFVRYFWKKVIGIWIHGAGKTCFTSPRWGAF